MVAGGGEGEGCACHQTGALPLDGQPLPWLEIPHGAGNPQGVGTACLAFRFQTGPGQGVTDITAAGFEEGLLRCLFSFRGMTGFSVGIKFRRADLLVHPVTVRLPSIILASLAQGHCGRA